MRKYKHILAVVEPGNEHQSALTRALEISSLAPDTRITVMIAMYDFSTELTSVLDVQTQLDLKNRLMATHEQMIEETMSRLNAKNADLECKVVWQRNVTRAIVDEINSSDYDLLIKDVDDHEITKELMFTTLDWKLLRYSPIPVIITKEHKWESGANILVAVNFDDQDEHEQRLMNLRLLRHAQQLATIIKGNIHLINAAEPISPSTLVEIPGFSPDLYTEAVYNHNHNKLTAFARKHRIPQECCHICVGQADDVIHHKVRELNATALLIGSSARKGLAGTVVGNVCEQITDEVDCDIMVISKNILK